MHNDVARPWSCSHAHIQNGDHKGVALFRDSGIWIVKPQTNRPSRNSTAQPHQETCRYYCHLIKFSASGKYDAILDRS